MEQPHSAAVVVAKEKFKGLGHFGMDDYKLAPHSLGQGTAQRVIKVVQHVLANCISHYSSLKVVSTSAPGAMLMTMEQGVRCDAAHVEL